LILTNKKNVLIFCLFAWLLWLCGCTTQAGTDTGNPAIVGIQFVGIQKNSPEKLSTKFLPSGITLTEARIVLKEIDLEPLVSCQTEEGTTRPESIDVEIDFVGPFVVDLLDNFSIPNIDDIQIPPGRYCEIELNFDKLEKENLPEGISPDDPIVENALLIQGTRQDGTPFLVRLKEDDRFKLEGTSPSGFTIAGDRQITQFFVSFDLNTWFTGVDLEAAVLSDGVILIDDANNAALKDQIVENIIHSSRLFKDLNNDGVLEDIESNDDLVLGEGIDEID
jgi:hypothetical protein